MSAQRRAAQPSAECDFCGRLRGSNMILRPPSSLLEASQIIAEFADLPPKPPRSKLEPHRDLIRELRRKGQTYRDVARLFQERLGLYVAPSTLHSFVKVRQSIASVHNSNCRRWNLPQQKCRLSWIVLQPSRRGRPHRMRNLPASCSVRTNL